MGNLLENLYDVLFQPTVAMRNVAANKKVGQALAVFFLSVTIPVWAVYFGLQSIGMPQAINAILLVQVIGSLLMWIVGSALLHLIAEFLGGQGSAIGLFAALGFAQFPRLFIVPLWVLAALMPAGIRPALMGISALIILFWVLTLHVYAIKGAHSLGGVRASLVLAVPFLAAFALLAIMITFISAAMMRWPLFI